MNASKTDNPGNTIGDTWVQIQGKFLLGAIRPSEIGSTGCEATHTLALQEMPVHNHYIGAHVGNAIQTNQGGSYNFIYKAENSSGLDNATFFPERIYQHVRTS